LKGQTGLRVILICTDQKNSYNFDVDLKIFRKFIAKNRLGKNAKMPEQSRKQLIIDAKAECEKIEDYIRQFFNSSGAGGILIGLSGGVDSAVLAALAARAIGKDKVFAYYLYDRDSSKQSKANAELIAGQLGIKLESEDITEVMRQMKIYSPAAMKLVSLSGAVNSLLNRIMPRGKWFIYTLQKDKYKNSLLYQATVGAIETAFYARHVYRRQFLEKKAKQGNFLLIGAANRSELLTGWFVKGGIDDLSFSPLTALYKTQVFQLAEYLNIPQQICSQRPSPDMMKGITDEAGLGIRYDILDIILYGIDNGLSDEQIISEGISIKDLRLVKTLHRLSQWKRMPEKIEIS
jgi:NAD+ synthase